MKTNQNRYDVNYKIIGLPLSSTHSRFVEAVVLWYNTNV
jgi:hypothetical protein